MSLLGRLRGLRFVKTLKSAQFRWASTASTGSTQPKLYQAIPKTPTLPGIGSLWQFILPGSWNVPLYQLQMRRIKKYGTIYRDTIPMLNEYVVVCKPDDIEAVYRQGEGQYPSRFTPHEWRQTRKDIGVGLGILMLENEEWFKTRAPISKFIMVPRRVGEFHQDFNKITLELLEAVRRSRDEKTNVVRDVPSLLFNWSLESVSFFVLGKRMGCLPDPSKAPQDCKDFIAAINAWFKATQDLFFAVPPFKQRVIRALRDATKKINNIALHHVQQKLKLIREQDEKASGSEAPENVDFLTYIVHSGQLSLEDIVLNAIDLIGAGVDTTSLAFAWTLYCIATNPEQQMKLRKEVQSVVGTADIVSPAHINQMPYLRSCVKEALRLYPITGSTSRYLKEDVVLSGYQVPAGTLILMPLTVIARMPEMYPEPLRYLPERWSREEDSGAHMFGSLPFGFGTRMCVGRRIAELEIHIGLAQAIKHFELDFTEKEPLDIKERGVVGPSRAMNLSFKDL